MGDFYRIYQTHQTEMYNALIGIMFLGAAFAGGWFIIPMVLSPRLRAYVEIFFFVICAAIYSLLVIAIGGGQ